MPLPLLVPLLLAAAGTGLGAYSLYNQHKQREVYQKDSEVTEEFKKGTQDYLAKQGRSINPARSWKAYDHSLLQNSVNFGNSVISSGNTLSGMTSKGLYQAQKAYNRRL